MTTSSLTNLIMSTHGTDMAAHLAKLRDTIEEGRILLEHVYLIIKEVVETIKSLYIFLLENVPGFVYVEMIPRRVINGMVAVFKQNKVLVISLCSLTTKIFIREVAKLGTKTVMKYVSGEVASQPDVNGKVALQPDVSGEVASKPDLSGEVADQPGVNKTLVMVELVWWVADIGQFGLELIGYQDTGKKVGFFGNIITGAITGAVILRRTRRLGAALGAIMGFGVWAFGEAVGQVIEI